MKSCNISSCHLSSIYKFLFSNKSLYQNFGKVDRLHFTQITSKIYIKQRKENVMNFK